MVRIKGRNLRKSGGTTPPDPSKKVEIKITLKESFSNPSVDFAVLKYNKKSGFIMAKDDGFVEDYTIGYAYLKGGIVAADGVTYPGVRYTDGSGKAVTYKMTFAFNTATPKTGGAGNDYLTSWKQYKEIIAGGFDLSNHSHAHSGYDKLFQVKENERITFNETGWRHRTFVIPTVDEGYANTAPNLGYLMVGSSFGDPARDDFEGATADTYGVYWGGKLNAGNFRRDKLLFNRLYTGEGNPGDLDAIKDLVNTIITANQGGITNYVGHWFSHGLKDANSDTFDQWKNLIQYIRNHPGNNDTVWMAGMQEFSEYCEVKDLAIKSQVLSGRELMVTLNLSNVSERNRLRDMSLVLKGGTISTVTVNGADDFSFNPDSGLINIYKMNPVVSNPGNDLLPAQIIKAVRSGNSVMIAYDKAVTQSVYSNSRGDAYKISDNSVLNITGSGKNWVLNCQNQISASATMDYRMQRGNATDGDGLKVCSYIGYPITL